MKMWKEIVCPLLDGKPQARLAALPVCAIFQGELTAMSLGDLPAEDQTNAGAARLGREEWHEKVGGVGKSKTFVNDPHVELRALPGPPNLNGAPGFESGIRGIANQVDQQLLQLVSVGGNDHVRTVHKANFYASLEFDGAANPLLDLHRQQFWLWQ